VVSGWAACCWALRAVCSAAAQADIAALLGPVLGAGVGVVDGGVVDGAVEGLATSTCW
jgi:hypothetical protein